MGTFKGEKKECSGIKGKGEITKQEKLNAVGAGFTE